MQGMMRVPVLTIFDLPVTVMKDFKKNAQFPGFRKGTIPPFMLPKVKQFVILDCLEKTLSEAVKDEVTVCPTLFSQTLPSPCRTEPAVSTQALTYAQKRLIGAALLHAGTYPYWN
jgi:hypothetical protein